MRSPALDSSDSRGMPYVLRKDKKLRYIADGSNNLVELIPDVIQMAKAAQPAFHRVLADRAIPPEWETPFPAPDPAVYAAMDAYERDCLKDDRQQHENEDTAKLESLHACFSHLALSQHIRLF